MPCNQLAAAASSNENMCMIALIVCCPLSGSKEARKGKVMPGFEPNESAAREIQRTAEIPESFQQPHLLFTEGCNFRIREAVLASCSAPTFFPGGGGLHCMCKLILVYANRLSACA